MQINRKLFATAILLSMMSMGMLTACHTVEGVGYHMDARALDPASRETLHDRFGDRHHRIEVAEGALLDPFIDPITHPTACEAVDSRDGRDTRRAGNAPVHYIGAVAVGVHNVRGELRAEPAHRFALQGVRPAREHHRRHPHSFRFQRGEKWVRSGGRIHQCRHANPMAHGAVATSEHPDHALEAAHFGRSRDVQYCQ